MLLNSAAENKIIWAPEITLVLNVLTATIQKTISNDIILSILSKGVK